MSTKKTKQQKHAERVAEKKHAHEEHEAEVANKHEDDLIVAPKGSSRLRFVFTLILTIFLLVIFMVSGEMLDTLGGGGASANRAYMSWEHPELGPQTMSIRDFTTQKQAYNRLQSSIFTQRQTVTDEEMATFLVEDQLARDAGIQVTDRDLAGFLRDTLQIDMSTYTGFVRSQGMTITGFEAELRRYLRVQRYRTLLGQSLMFPDPSEIESKWNNQFQEYSFDYVQLDPEDFSDEARAELPADEELQAWFDALPEFQRNNFRTEKKSAADLVLFRLDGSLPPPALMEAYPMPEDADLDSIARTYYNIARDTRFRREAEETPDEPEDEPEEPEDPYLPYEEVAELCKAEAPVYNAFRDWILQMQVIQRDPNQELDLAAQAAEVGLTFQADPTLRTATEWEELDGLGGQRLSAFSRFGKEGDVFTSVLVEEDAMYAGQWTTVEEPKIPEFADMRESVVDSWVEERRAEIALEKLEAVFEGFLDEGEEAPTLGGIEVPKDEFVAAVQAAGFEVENREWRDRVQQPPGGFAEASPIENFLRMQTTMFILAENQVGAPAINQQKDAVFLLRSLGSRDPENVEMKPRDVRNVENNVRATAIQGFSRQAFGFDALADRFDLRLLREDLEGE